MITVCFVRIPAVSLTSGHLDTLGPASLLWTPGTNQQCPDHQGVLIFQVSLYNKESFGTTSKCVDYAGVLILKCPD